MWHRRGKDTNGSTGEWNNTNIIWGQEGRQGCGTGGGKIQMGVLVKGITQKLYGEQEGRQGCGTGGGKIQMGVLVIRITQKLYGGKREDRAVAQEGERYRWEYW